jgi:prolyl-tRNA synthetase
MSAISHKLLYQAGFIRELSTGRYEILPLGQRVINKLIDMIDKEMEAIGSQRFAIPLLQPIEYWKKTNRDGIWGKSLMRITDRNNSDFVLSATGEGVVTEMVKDAHPSYKDLPIIVHQFIAKFRDEIRPRGGLLRVREFIMKDAYSYNTTEEDFMKTYQEFSDSYSRICTKLGLEHYACFADSGALGGDYCHEFQIPCEAGEDYIAKCDSCGYAANIEKAEFVRKEVNKDQELLPYTIVDLPKEVGKMKELVAHYNLPEECFIKNVVYKTQGNKLVIATVTGNLDVNPAKLTKAVNQGELELATTDDLTSIGTQTGFVHSWGYEKYKDRIIFVIDESILHAKNLYGGYKTDTTDPINVNYERDFTADIVADIAEPFAGATCDQCKKGKISLLKTIEFGHIFKYDHFYTGHHNAYFTDKDGKEKLMYMGAYGIGIERCIAIVVESHHDEKGILWPEVIAPYKFHLITDKDPNTLVEANKIYELLKDDCLWDERDDVSMGEKFADADLIGIPYRIVCSKRSIENGGIEIKKRNETETKIIKNIEQLLKEC